MGMHKYALALLAFGGRAQAQNYPTKSVLKFD
jgi:hypothetical protein